MVSCLLSDGGDCAAWNSTCEGSDAETWARASMLCDKDAGGYFDYGAAWV